MTNQPSRSPKPSQPPDPRLRWSVTLGALFLLTMCAGLVTVTMYIYTWIDIPDRLARNVPASTMTAAIPAPGVETIPKPTPLTENLTLPTPDSNCVETLTLGTHSFRIEAIALPVDGNLPVLPDNPGVVYRVESTENNFVFALSSNAENQSLRTTLQVEDLVSVTLTECNTQSYRISEMQSVQFSADLLDPSQADFTLLIIEDALNESLVIHGIDDQIEFQEYVLFTPQPEDLLVSVSLEQVRAPEDSQTIQVTLSISNFGVSSVTFNPGDIDLSVEGELPIGFISSQPTLPQVLEPGQNRSFDFTFSRPVTGLGVLRIFSVEYNLEDFQ